MTTDRDMVERARLYIRQQALWFAEHDKTLGEYFAEFAKQEAERALTAQHGRIAELEAGETCRLCGKTWVEVKGEACGYADNHRCIINERRRK
jgi:hypothetical protein